MGRALYENDAVFRDHVQKQNAIVMDLTGKSVVDIIYNDVNKKSDAFDDILYTHPAVFMIGYAMAMTLIERRVQPDFVVGSSLGEYIAATVAGVFSVEQSLDIIVKQSQMMNSLSNDGTMLAIVHDVSLFHNEDLLQQAELAGVHFAGHFVVAGENSLINRIVQFLKNQNILYQELPVRQGFHSEMLDPIEYSVMTSLMEFSFNRPAIPFISVARPGIMYDLTPEYLWYVIRGPMLFQDTMEFIEGTTIPGKKIYIDVGPAGTMATFAKYNIHENSDSISLPILSPFSLDVKNFQKVLDVVKN